MKTQVKRLAYSSMRHMNDTLIVQLLKDLFTFSRWKGLRFWVLYLIMYAKLCSNIKPSENTHSYYLRLLTARGFVWCLESIWSPALFCCWIWIIVGIWCSLCCSVAITLWLLSWFIIIIIIFMVLSEEGSSLSLLMISSFDNHKIIQRVINTNKWSLT